MAVARINGPAPTTQKDPNMPTPATTDVPHDVRIDKTNVPSTAIRDQATTGLYFEYTYGMCMIDPAKGGNILLRNVSLFAVHKTLLLRRSIAEIKLPPNKAATFQATDLQQNFRSSAKSEQLTDTMTKELAFLTVMRAWEFATMRPQVAKITVQDNGGTLMPITVGAHWLISEPVQWPITAKDTDALRTGNDDTTARRLASQADAYWTDISTEPATADGTPAHRFPRGEITKLDTGTLVGRIATELVSNDPEDVPEFVPSFSDATNTLPDILKAVAQSDQGW